MASVLDAWELRGACFSVISDAAGPCALPREAAQPLGKSVLQVLPGGPGLFCMQVPAAKAGGAASSCSTASSK